MRIAIAFGYGAESMQLLRRYLNKRPMLVICHGPEDDVDEGVSRLLAKKLKLKLHILQEGFKENWVFDKHWLRESTVDSYTNNILEHFKGNGGLPFDKLISGRRRIDLIKRGVIRNPPVKKPEIKNMKFPLWND